MRIGLLGGTFNPPHAGHIHNSELSMKYLGLDAVWWLVTPGNPLKSKVGLADVATRMAWCRTMIDHPKIIVSDIESQLETTRTFDSISALLKKFSKTEFVWLAGTEIAHEFHKWHKWDSLITLLPFAFVGRPTHHGVVRNTVFHRHAQLQHTTLLHGSTPPLKKGCIYWIFSESRNPLSSTMLRERNNQFAPDRKKV